MNRFLKVTFTVWCFGVAMVSIGNAQTAQTEPQVSQGGIQGQLVTGPPSNPSQFRPVYVISQPQSAPQGQPIENFRTEEFLEGAGINFELRKKQRDALEKQTEEKLIERLEDDRVTSEKQRAERIMAPRAPATTAATQPQS